MGDLPLSSTKGAGVPAVPLSSMRLRRSTRSLIAGMLFVASAGCGSSIDDHITNTPGNPDVLDLWVRTHTDDIETISSALRAERRTETRDFRPVPVWTLDATSLSAACDKVQQALAASNWTPDDDCQSNVDEGAGHSAATRAGTATGHTILRSSTFALTMSVRVEDRGGLIVAYLVVDNFRRED